MSDRLTINPGLRYTLNFPSTEINGQTAVFNLQTQQLEYPGTNPVRPLKKNNFGPRLGVVYRLTDKTIVSAGYGLVWIEMAGITTPFTTPTFPFLQTVSQRALDTISPAFVLQNGPSVAPIAPTPTAGLGQGVFAVDGTLGSGYVQQWNVVGAAGADDEHDRRGRVRRIEHHARRHSGQQPQSADRQPARAGSGAELSGCRIRTSASSRGRRRSAIRRFRSAQLLKPYPEYTTVSLYRNNVGTTRYQGFELEPSAAALARAVVLGRLHALQAGGRCLVGVRRVDPDRADRELSGGRQLQPRARARLLDRRHPARLRVVGGVGSSRRRGPRAAAARRARRDRQRLDHDDARHARSRACRSRSRRRRTSTRSPASACSGRIWSAIRRCRPISGRPASGSTRRRSPSRRSSRSARRRGIRSADRRIATSTSR